MPENWQVGPDSYRQSVEAERRVYENCTDVHALPAIFHYWSNRYLRPKLQCYGYESLAAVFEKNLATRCRAGARFVSLGSGNCDFELSLARYLKRAGYSDFSFLCLDLNPTMLHRGKSAAEAEGLARHFEFTEADLNSWRCGELFDAAIANQSLHHIVNLEGLFDNVRSSLSADGVFIVSDMIGRNGHQRWPEALDVVQRLWEPLPPSYKVNRKFGHFEFEFENQDCSSDGFEGVRSQDILPLLAKRFSFQFFLGYGNLIDVFIDRTFGPNFDPAQEPDRRFIDMVHTLDDHALLREQLTPTHLLAVLAREGKSVRVEGSIRHPDAPRPRWNPVIDCSFMHGDPERELNLFTERMAAARETLRAQTDWAAVKERELNECTAWAHRLDAERETLTEQLHERTRWAQSLEADLQTARTALAALQEEFERRTEWALAMSEELARANADIESLNARLNALSEPAPGRIHRLLARFTTLLR